MNVPRGSSTFRENTDREKNKQSKISAVVERKPWPPIQQWDFINT